MGQPRSFCSARRKGGHAAEDAVPLGLWDINEIVTKHCRAGLTNAIPPGLRLALLNPDPGLRLALLNT